MGTPFFSSWLPTVGSTFTGTFTLGSAVIAVLLLGIAGYFAAKGKQAQSANTRADDWREEFLAQKEVSEGLREKYEEQRKLKHDALTENATLKMATDLTLVMRELTEIKSDLSARMTSAEERIAKQLTMFAETQQAQTKVLDAIATRLNGGAK